MCVCVCVCVDVSPCRKTLTQLLKEVAKPLSSDTHRQRWLRQLAEAASQVDSVARRQLEVVLKQADEYGGYQGLHMVEREGRVAWLCRHHKDDPRFHSAAVVSLPRPSSATTAHAGSGAGAGAGAGAGSGDRARAHHRVLYEGSGGGSDNNNNGRPQSVSGDQEARAFEGTVTIPLLPLFPSCCDTPLLARHCIRSRHRQGSKRQLHCGERRV